MTAIPLELPVKASEAASLADLLFQQLEGRPLTDDQRSRMVARAGSLELSSIRPYWGSLQHDPIHSTTYYLAVDGAAVSDPAPRPLLLRMALASAPSSALFPKAVLIGRMRPGAGREVVVNAVPFSPEDIAAIRTFTEKVDPAFLPRAQGVQAALTFVPANPAHDLPAAFEIFQDLHKSTGMNAAAFEAPLDTCLWAAVRAGWRHGYAVTARAADAPAALERIGCSRFAVPAADPAAAGAIYDAVRRQKIVLGLNRVFDLEVAGLEDPSAFVEAMKEEGRFVQAWAPEWEDTLLETRAALARRHNLTLTVDPPAEALPEAIRRLQTAAGARWNCAVHSVDCLRRAAAVLRPNL